ncbi:MAG TPA: dual specificity protein phosphatase family protein [Longilinea sp.]|nr:dual specificity protein phosphatase family protein [Longilinea sp.]
MTQPFPHTPFSNSYWVEPDKFLAGEYPIQNEDEERSQRKIDSLIRTGITTIIDLTQPWDAEEYASLLEKEAVQSGKTVEHQRFGINDFSTPDPNLMVTILDAIDTAIDNGKMVYVHCVGGFGRTGTVVGCYLVRHGMSGEAALEHIHNLRRYTAHWWKSSPESADQRDFVKKWKEPAG